MNANIIVFNPVSKCKSFALYHKCNQFALIYFYAIISIMNQDINKQLKNANLKVTQARVGVLKYLQTHQKPSDVQDILSYLHKEKISADQATVYRMLKIFEDMDLVRSIELNEGKVRYEGTSLPHHHHVICIKCGQIEDLEDCDVNALEKHISERLSFKVQTHRLDFFGLCQNCKD